MQIITRKTQANSAAARFARNYKPSHNCEAWPVYQWGDTGYIYQSLLELGSNPKPNDVEAILKGWTTPGTCSECGEVQENMLIQLGEEPDYESHTAYICVECLHKAWGAVANESTT